MTHLTKGVLLIRDNLDFDFVSCFSDVEKGELPAIRLAIICHYAVKTSSQPIKTLKLAGEMYKNGAPFCQKKQTGIPFCIIRLTHNNLPASTRIFSPNLMVNSGRVIYMRRRNVV